MPDSQAQPGGDAEPVASDADLACLHDLWSATRHCIDVPREFLKRGMSLVRAWQEAVVQGARRPQGLVAAMQEGTETWAPAPGAGEALVEIAECGCALTVTNANPGCKKHEYALASGDRPRCKMCGEPATCLGAYEGMTKQTYGCDTCCGHGNEDGRCEPVPACAPAAKEPT